MPAQNPRRIGTWLAIAVGIAAASISANKAHKADRPIAKADRTAAHVTLVFPLN